MRYSRDQYFDREVTHDTYYGQFVKDWHVKLAIAMFGEARLRSALAEDVHLNDIPLGMWDRMGRHLNTKELRDELKACGDGIAMATLVCVGKAAAKKACQPVSSL